MARRITRSRLTLLALMALVALVSYACGMGASAPPLPTPLPGEPSTPEAVTAPTQAIPPTAGPTQAIFPTAVPLLPSPTSPLPTAAPATQEIVATRRRPPTSTPEALPTQPQPFGETPAGAATPTAEIFVAPTAGPTSAATSVPAIQEARRLTLEWPPTLRAGDSDVVRLTLEMDEQGNLVPTAEIQGHETRGETVFIPNLYDTHKVLAEAWLDIAGITVDPQERLSQPLLPGQKVTFYWSVHAEKVGDYRGTVWLKLRFVPKAGGAESELVISAQLIEIRAVNLLGIGGASARVLGGVGALLGSVLSLDSIVEWGIKLAKRRKRNT